MRIGYLCHKYPLGGQVRAVFVHELAKSVRDLGHEVHVLIPREDGPGKSLIVDNIRVHQRVSPLKLMHLNTVGSVDDAYVSRPRASMVKFVVSGIVELSRLAKKLDLDVIHSHWAIPMGIVATSSRLLHHLPVVITAHGRDLYLNSMDGESRDPTWARPITRFALRAADRTIFTTEDYATYGKEYGIPKSRCVVIPNGVDVDMFRPSLDGAALRARIGAGENDFVMLYVGSFDRKKGLPSLIKATSGLITRGRRVRLVMAGGGPLDSYLERLIGELGLLHEVTMLGPIRHSDLPLIYAGCDLYVQPSLIEPFGIVALEAAASGKPVVATNVPGLRSVVTADTGLLVPPDDPDALVSAIDSIIDLPERCYQMGMAGRERVVSMFSWRSVARQTLDCYEDLLR